MKISVSLKTASRGSSLGKNLVYLADYIADEFARRHLTTSFDEISVTFAFPPLFMLPGVLGMEKSFMEYYKSLPVLRIERKNKKIVAIIPAPEFTEYCDHRELSFESAGKDITFFEVPDAYKNLSEITLAKIFIKHLLKTMEEIYGKLKKNDVFDFEHCKKILDELYEKISNAFLEKNFRNYQQKLKTVELHKAVEAREKRKSLNMKKNKLLRDIRVFAFLPQGQTLSPFDYIYCEIFLHILQRENFLCPTYHHIYIRVAAQKQDALRDSINMENWYTYGIAVLDYEQYRTMSLEEKERKVFDVICSGLYDVAELDKLDKNILAKAIAEIQLKGLETELIHYSGENKNYKVQISYFVKSRDEGCPIYLTVKDKSLKKTVRKLLGTAQDTTQLRYWLRHINLTSSSLKIQSAKSFRAGLYIQDKPKILNFTLRNEFSEKEMI